MSNFWFDRFADDIPNHRADLALADVLTADEIAQVETRAMLVRRLAALPVEAVARGYIIGSGWNDYQATGAVSGIELPAGLRQAEQLPQPIFTPSTKAEAGDHDEAIDFDRVVALVGEDRATRIRHATLSIYKRAPRPMRANAASSSPTPSSSSASTVTAIWCSSTRCSRRIPRASGRCPSTRRA